MPGCGSVFMLLDTVTVGLMMSAFFRASLEVQWPLGDRHWSVSIATIEGITNRNKLFFSLLAGGSEHFSIKPISQLRGLPDDVNDEIRTIYKNWGDMAFDASWATYPELIAGIEKLYQAAELVAEDPSTFVSRCLSVNLRAVLAYMGTLFTEGELPRLVFWQTLI